MNATATPQNAAPAKASTIKQRCTGGVIAIGLLAAIVTIDRRLEHPWVAVALTCFLGIVGAHEFGRMIAAGGHAIRRGDFVLFAAALLLGKVWCYVAAPAISPLEFSALLVCGWLLANLSAAVIGGDARGGIERVAYGALGLGYVGLYSFLLDLLLAPASPRGVELALFVVFASKANDIGGYLAGNFIGGAKLAPKVSPGKTRAGSVGGVALSVVVTMVGARWIGLEFATWQLVVFAVVVSAATQFGDLAESLLKRACAVKDSGSLLPTFGGALDVIDSLAFASPVGYVFLRALSALS